MNDHEGRKASNSVKISLTRSRDPMPSGLTTSWLESLEKKIFLSFLWGFGYGLLP